MIITLGALLGMLGGVVAAAPALAGGQGTNGRPSSQSHRRCPLAGFCGFPAPPDRPGHQGVRQDSQPHRTDPWSLRPQAR